MQQPKGPNALNIMAYMQGQEQQGQLIEQEGVSSRPNIDAKAIEQQFDTFVRDMQKYDKILSEVAKNIEEIEGENEFITDFYPRFIYESTYEDDQQKKIVARNDRELARIIENLEKNNKILKEDMRSWVFEFAKTAKLTEVLVSQNKVLRQSIAKKNKEIVKLIQGIGQAQNQQIAELVENLDLLRQENGVLKQHFHRLSQEISQKRDQQQRVAQTLQRTQQQLQLLHKQKAETQDQEEHLSKTLELVEQWRVESQRRKRKLEKERDALRMEKNELQGDKARIEQELLLCQRQQNELQGGLKKDFKTQQNQKYQILQEIHQLGDTIAKYKNDCRYLEEESARNLSRKQQYAKVTQKYQERIASNVPLIQQLQKQLQAATQAHVEVLCQVDLQKLAIEGLQREFEDLQQREKSLKEQCKRKSKDQQEETTRQLGQWQNKLSQNQRELAMRILRQKSQVSTKQKELQRWQQKVYDKKQQLSDLKAQMKEIKENQQRLGELKAKLSQLQRA